MLLQASSRAALKPTHDPSPGLSLPGTPDGSRHPLLLILAPQEHGEGEIGGLPRGQGDGSRARSSQAVPRVCQGHYVGKAGGDQLSVQSAFVSRGWRESDSCLKLRL